MGAEPEDLADVTVDLRLGQRAHVARGEHRTEALRQVTAHEPKPVLPFLGHAKRGSEFQYPADVEDHGPERHVRLLLAERAPASAVPARAAPARAVPARAAPARAASA